MVKVLRREEITILKEGLLVVPDNVAIKTNSKINNVAIETNSNINPQDASVILLHSLC